jgi:hypothetical protein
MKSTEYYQGLWKGFSKRNKQTAWLEILHTHQRAFEEQKARHSYIDDFIKKNNMRTGSDFRRTEGQRPTLKVLKSVLNSETNKANKMLS